MPKVAKSCQKLPKVTKSYQKVSKVAKCYQKLPKVIKNCQLPKVANSCQQLPNDQQFPTSVDTHGGTGGLLELLSQLKTWHCTYWVSHKNVSCFYYGFTQISLAGSNWGSLLGFGRKKEHFLDKLIEIQFSNFWEIWLTFVLQLENDNFR